MKTRKIITGISVDLQMSKARFILNNEVIPREELFWIRKKENNLTEETLQIINSFNEISKIN